RRESHRSRRVDRVSRRGEVRQALVPLRRAARAGQPAPRAGRVVQRLLLRRRRQARHRSHGARRRGPRLRRTDGARAQRRGAGHGADRGVAEEARRSAARRGAQHRHRPGLDQGHGDAAGDGLRGDRQRRQAVGAAGGRADRDARRQGGAGVPAAPPAAGAGDARAARVRALGAGRRGERSEGHQLRRARARARRRRQDRHRAGRQQAGARRGGRRDLGARLVRQLRAVEVAQDRDRRARRARRLRRQGGDARRHGNLRRLFQAQRERLMAFSLRKLRAQFDWLLAGGIAAIVPIGLVNLYSATRVAPRGLYTQQLVWFAVGLVLFVLVAAVDYRVYERYAYALYGVGLVLLVAVLVGGKVVKGSSRWLSIGPVGIQPSELAKIAVIIALAKIFSGDPMDLALRPWAYVAGALGLLGIPMLLVMKQPDLGTALILYLIGTTILMLVPLQ